MAKKKRDDAQPDPQTKPAGTDDNAAAETASGKKKQPTWRASLEFAVTMAGAVVIALLIKAYAFDVYLIPSGSMETALHGRPDGGDRIFCSKFNFHFRQPKRWEVAVFEFPYETARRSDEYKISEQYKGQNFVKRVVGLPNESLAIAKGDIWVRGEGMTEYQRMVKPDAVQRGMWLNVYEEDFRDLRRDELNLFWKIMGGEVRLGGGGPLVLSPENGAVRMEYRPMVPVGREQKRMLELAGVPDRYTLEQPVQFRCLNLVSGEACGHIFTKTLRTQNMLARCPKCESLQDETSAVFYHRRSGLTAVGRYAVIPRLVPQGEEVPPRQSEYHIVPDLRVVTDATLAGTESRLAITLREDSRFVQAIFHGNGQVEFEINGETSRPEHRMLVEIVPGRKHRIEFYIVDGTARVFVDSEQTALLDEAIWQDKRPMPRALPAASGVSIGAAGGDITIDRLIIDRDIFYYSGWERERGEMFSKMNTMGEVYINSDSFYPMGDHCPSSFDARSWGPVPTNLLRGPALLIWWPPERIGSISSP